MSTARLGIFRLPRQQLRLHPDRHATSPTSRSTCSAGDRGAAAILLVLAQPALVDLSARRAVPPVALATCRRLPAHLVLGRPARRARARAGARRAGSVPERGAIILTAFVVVAFSIFVQGLTMPWLIKRLRLGASDDRSGCRCRAGSWLGAPAREPLPEPLRIPGIPLFLARPAQRRRSRRWRW